MPSTTHDPPPPDALPQGDETGHRRTWRLPTTTVDDADVEAGSVDVDAPEPVGVLVVAGTFLGVGSSRQERHRNHAPGTPARPDDRCGACRWFETRIFRLTGDDYVLHHTGVSTVPGERDLHRHERAYSPFEVLELYTVRRWESGRRETFLTKPAIRALAQAAGFDADLRDLYEQIMAAS